MTFETIQPKYSQKTKPVSSIVYLKLVRLVVLLTLLALVMIIIANPGRAQTQFRLGALPVLPSAQAFLLANDKSTDIFDVVPFKRDMDIIDALVEREIDIAYADPEVVLRKRDKGAPIEVIATASVDSTALIMRGSLAENITPGLVAESLSRIAQQENLSFVGLVGSSSTAALQAWMNRNQKFSNGMIGLKRGRLGTVWRSMLRETIQAAILPEPALTHILETDLTARIVLPSRDILAGLPTVLVVAWQPLVAERRAALINLLNHHIAATKLLEDEPEKAAKRLVPMIGYGDLSIDLIERALRSSITHFKTDPRSITAGMEDLQAILMSQGRIRGHFILHNLINTTLYQEASSS